MIDNSLENLEAAEKNAPPEKKDDSQMPHMPDDVAAARAGGCLLAVTLFLILLTVLLLLFATPRDQTEIAIPPLHSTLQHTIYRVTTPPLLRPLGPVPDTADHALLIYLNQASDSLLELRNTPLYQQIYPHDPLLTPRTVDAVPAALDTQTDTRFLLPGEWDETRDNDGKTLSNEAL